MAARVRDKQDVVVVNYYRRQISHLITVWVSGALQNVTA